jgi:hypothetical protein
LLRERALRGETNGVLFDRTRPSTASSAQQTLAHTTPLPTRTATTNGPLTPRATPRPSSGVVAHTTVRSLPAAASVTSTKPLPIADGSVGAGGKISPESTVTRCAGAAAQPETSEVTFIVQNPRCDGHLSRLLQWNVGSANNIVFDQCATVLSVRVCQRHTAPSPTCVAARCPLTISAETQLPHMISRLLFACSLDCRTGSLFMSGRLQKYGSGRFTYKWVRAKTMVPRPFGATATIADWLHHACGEIPGYKVVVYDSGSSPNWWVLWATVCHTYPCRCTFGKLVIHVKLNPPNTLFAVRAVTLL